MEHPTPQDQGQEPDSGPLDRPEHDPQAPIGDDAYPGGSGMNPPTADLDDPIPETGMPGEPELEDEDPYERPQRP